MPKMSIVCPCFNEARNLPILHQRIETVMEGTDVDWQLIVVDDHSTDDGFGELERLAKADNRIVAVRLARNVGSHMAIICGLEFVTGDCTVVMASDLEDPPEVLPQFLEQWRAGHKVVWGAREQRQDKSKFYVFFANLYHRFAQNVVGLKGIPATGVDFFLMDGEVVKMVRQFKDKNITLFALVAWLDQDSAVIHYTKDTRLHGQSGWTLAKRLTLVLDTLLNFSHTPIRVMGLLGLFMSIAGAIYGLEVLFNAYFGNPPAGWSALMIIVLIIGGTQMMMIGVLGEYLWRTLEETRSRPRYLFERIVSESPIGRADMPNSESSKK